MTHNRDTGDDGVPTALAARRGDSNRHAGHLRGSVLAACALLGGVLGGTGGFALAAGPWHGGWHHGPRLETIQRIALRALDGVGATTAQEGKIHDIIAKTFADVSPDPAERQAMRTQAFDLLRAPSVDRASVERLRAEQVARFDVKSKALVAALLDAADQLTPDQRSRLADRFAAMGRRHHESHGPGGDWTRSPDKDEMDRDHGPDGGPDHDPSKG